MPKAPKRFYPGGQKIVKEGIKQKRRAEAGTTSQPPAATCSASSPILMMPADGIAAKSRDEEHSAPRAFRSDRRTTALELIGGRGPAECPDAAAGKRRAIANARPIGAAFMMDVRTSVVKRAGFAPALKLLTSVARWCGRRRQSQWRTPPQASRS